MVRASTPEGEDLNAPSSIQSLKQPDAAALSVREIAQALALAFNEPCAIEAVTVTGSTHDDLVARYRVQQAARRLLRAAAFQTGGRGRQKRVWHAAPGAALLFSLAIPVSARPKLLPAVTLACGVVLAECLEAHGAMVQLKWPNDIRVDGRKLAGILTEWVSDRDTRHTLVIGVGMNVHLDDAARRAIGQPAIALDQLLPAASLVSREQWMGRFAGAIFAAVERFVQDGFDPFYARFNRLLEARGEVVDVVNSDPGSKVISGRLIEVDDLGRLVVDAGGQRLSITAGDVSVRR